MANYGDVSKDDDDEDNGGDDDGVGPEAEGQRLGSEVTVEEAQRTEEEEPGESSANWLVP